MENKIRIMIIDDIQETRKNIGRLISLEEDLLVVAEAGSAEEGIEIAKEVQPEIILMDINLPGMDGLKATEILSRELPWTSIIMISVQEEHYYMRQAMTAGAREFLMKPFSRDELIKAIRQVFSIEKERQGFQDTVQKIRQRQSEVITVFSGKGGVGKSTIAVNLAAVLARETEEKVVVLDLDLQFGDVSLMLDLDDRLTMIDVIDQIEEMDAPLLENYLKTHSSGVKVLAAPARPEEAELVKSNHINKMIQLLREHYRYIIIDTEPSFHENNLAALDYSEKIILVSVLELATVKNIHLSLEIMRELSYSNEKLYLILNRSNSKFGLKVQDIEDSLGLQVRLEIPDDNGTAFRALNTGEPFVLSQPKSPISKSIYQLATIIEPGLSPEQKSGFFQRFRKIFRK